MVKLNTYTILLYALYGAGGLLFLILLIVAIIKSRYRTFTNREFVLRFRWGKLINQGFGGGYFIWPIIDEIIVLSTTVQTQEIQASEVITQENQDVRVSGFVVWRIEDPVKAYQSIEGSQNRGLMTEINKTLAQLVESIIRTTVARLTLDQVLRERSLIIEAIRTELLPVVGPLGIVINTAEIRHVDVVDQELFHDLQEKYRQEARLNAQRVNIETSREIEKSKALSSQEVRLFQAQQDEVARVRELERDRKVAGEQKLLQLTEEERSREVQEQSRKREAINAKLDQERLQIEAETRLIEIELQAEAKKRQFLLEKVHVEAEQKKVMAEAEAEMIRKTATANKEAQLMSAEAQKESELMRAEAEARRLTIVAEARKKNLLAEAEGKKAILLAEAEGLREKVRAQGMINEAMLMQELIAQLPAIASSMKVGDINWLNMPGSGENGESPLGIIPKNMLHVMTLAKTFGLDLEGLIRTIRGQPQASESEMQQLIEQLDQNTEIMVNPIMDENNRVVGIDFDNDGDIDYHIPPNVEVLLDADGKIVGVDLDGDGELDLSLDEILANT